MYTMKYALLLTLMTLGLSATPIELGKVNWDRKIEPSIEQSSSDGKPIFLLFQELPG